MINLLKQHLKENSGDENISKMTWVAIVFVIGAILLLLTATAFKGPIQEWYNGVVSEWFAQENGEYSFDNYSMYEKNENGTYKGLHYVSYNEDGSIYVINANNVSEFNEDSIENHCIITHYNSNGNLIEFPVHAFHVIVSISPDGKSMMVDGNEYIAQLP